MSPHINPNDPDFQKTLRVQTLQMTRKKQSYQLLTTKQFFEQTPQCQLLNSSFVEETFRLHSFRPKKGHVLNVEKWFQQPSTIHPSYMVPSAICRVASIHIMANNSRPPSTWSMFQALDVFEASKLLGVGVAP